MLRTFAIIVTNVHELKFKDICVVRKLYFKTVYNLTLHGNVYSCFRQAEKSIVLIQ